MDRFLVGQMDNIKNWLILIVFAVVGFFTLSMVSKVI
jgi:hypothetical protein